MACANACHILVATEEKCLKLKDELATGADFAIVARTNSLCPSRMRGGDLGTFRQGDMVPEFDEAAFSGEIGTVLGPVKTEFGYHLLLVTSRW